MPWDKGAPSPAGTDAVLYAASQPEDASAAGNQTNTVSNLSLLNASYYVLHALKHQDYEALAQVIHPQRGVTCTPLSTVSPGSDRVLTPEQIRGLAGDPSVYTWGTSDERGAPVSMTMAQYFAQYVYDTDYTQAPLIGLDQVVISGNALENLNEIYPECRFVDFAVPGQEQANQGMDWHSLKLVFEETDAGWLLVAFVHGQWTG